MGTRWKEQFWACLQSRRVLFLNTLNKMKGINKNSEPKLLFLQAEFYDPCKRYLQKKDVWQELHLLFIRTKPYTNTRLRWTKKLLGTWKCRFFNKRIVCRNILTTIFWRLSLSGFSQKTCVTCFIIEFFKKRICNKNI